MSIKETILKMPAWKAVVCLIILMIACGAVVESVLVHTVFHFFDKTISKMENEKADDIDDLDSIGKQEQRDYCEEYRLVQNEKSDLAKRSPTEFSYDFAYSTMQGHEDDLQFAIKQHYFNLARCLKTIKSKGA